MDPRVVVVTGASSGIGRAAVVQFARRGDRVVLVARGQEDLETVARECGPGALVVPADISDRADVEAAAEAAIDRFGRIDVWVDTAAVMAYGRFEDIPADVFDRVIATDLIGPANIARVALRRFREQGGGTLIMCSSLLAHVTVPYMSTYVTAKWGLRGLIRTLRQETRDLPGVNVCTVAPGSVDTPIYTSAGSYAGYVGRPPPPVDSPERVAAAIVKLADHPKREVSVGATNRLIEAGFSFMPPVYDALVTTMMRNFGLSRRPAGANTGNVFRPMPRREGGPLRLTRGQVGAGVLTAGAALTLATTRLLRRR